MIVEVAMAVYDCPVMCSQKVLVSDIIAINCILTWQSVS